eukprot:scaffold2576_cov175-Amphora_coffeaeformis.AAC.5
MKVFLHYEDSDDPSLHKTLKITLPKSWKSGPTSKVLEQFIESYNGSTEQGNPLVASNMHLALRESDGEKSKLVPLPSDAVVVEQIPDRGDVYIMHGAAKSVVELQQEEEAAKAAQEEQLKNTVQCTHFGCQNRFPMGGPYPECCYHKAPPVFHETAKFWSCCPQKKAYDWETFQEIPGCETGICSEVKDDNQKLFLGGQDLREQAGEQSKLKSIDDFNKSQAAGGSDAAPVLERLQLVLEELGVENELFDQVMGGIRKDAAAKLGGATEADLLQEVKTDLGDKLKQAMKTIAAQQLRLK